MSTILPSQATCPACGATFSFLVAESINAARRPDHRAAILDGSLQQGACPTCGEAFRAAPELTFLDLSNNQWILVEPVERVRQWPALEEAAARVFASSWGERAPAPAQRLGKALRPRVTFGWVALREKLVCVDHGIDDVTLELLKMQLFQGLG